MGKDFFWLHLRDLPYFRAMLRSVEANYFRDYVFNPPILDVGCGDGHFASLVFDEPIDIGIDPWTGPIRQARRTTTDSPRTSGEAHPDRLRRQSQHAVDRSQATVRRRRGEGNHRPQRVA